MALKIPPPPQLTGPEWQSFNRWLLEVTSILTNQGGIDPSEVTGLPELFIEVATNTADITTLETTTGNQGGEIGVLNASILVVEGEITTINGQLTTLESNAVVYNGTVPPVALHNSGDWFADTVGKHIYVQVAGAWTLIL